MTRYDHVLTLVALCSTEISAMNHDTQQEPDG